MGRSIFPPDRLNLFLHTIRLRHSDPDPAYNGHRNVLAMAKGVGRFSRTLRDPRPR